MRPLSKKQLDCLRDAEQREINPWNYGSSTITRLKRERLIEPAGVVITANYRITAAGRAVLGGTGSAK